MNLIYIQKLIKNVYIFFLTQQLLLQICVICSIIQSKLDEHVFLLKNINKAD